MERKLEWIGLGRSILIFVHSMCVVLLARREGGSDSLSWSKMRVPKVVEPALVACLMQSSCGGLFLGTVK